MAMWRAWARGLLAEAGGVEALVAAPPPVPLREIFRQFWPDARPFRRWLWVALIFITLTPLIDTATIWLYKLLIDTVLVPRDFAAFGRLVLAYLALTLLGGLVSFGDGYLAGWVGEQFLLRLRMRFFRHLQALPPDFFTTRQRGDLLTRITEDVGAIEDLILAGVANALTYGLRLLFFGAMLVYLQRTLALAAVLVIPAFWLLAQVFARRIRRVSRERRRRSGSLSALAEETLANMPLIQAYNQEEAAAERFLREGQGRVAAQLAALRLKGLFNPLITLTELAGTLIVVAAGTWALARGHLSLGGLLAFLAYLQQLYGPVRGLSTLATTVHAASASAERLLEVLAQPPTITERPGARHLARAAGLVTFDAVTVRYPGGATPAVADVTLRVAPGEVLALVGDSGAGKSTLGKLLARFYDPSAGRVLLDGVDLRDLRLAALREQVTVLFQETLILNGTIRDNIAFGRPDADDAAIGAAARAADAHGFIAALPEGYATRVGQQGQRLSGGQRQRLAIARALLRDAPVLVLDEPTTGLDAATIGRLLPPLRRLFRGRTVLLITHDLALVREATTIAVLQDGELVEHGAHEALLRHGGAYARLWRARHGAAPTSVAPPAPDPSSVTPAGGRHDGSDVEQIIERFAARHLAQVREVQSSSLRPAADCAAMPTPSGPVHRVAGLTRASARWPGHGRGEPGGDDG